MTESAYEEYEKIYECSSNGLSKKKYRMNDIHYASKKNIIKPSKMVNQNLREQICDFKDSDASINSNGITHEQMSNNIIHDTTLPPPPLKEAFNSIKHNIPNNHVNEYSNIDTDLNVISNHSRVCEGFLLSHWPISSQQTANQTNHLDDDIVNTENILNEITISPNTQNINYILEQTAPRNQAPSLRNQSKVGAAHNDYLAYPLPVSNASAVVTVQPLPSSKSKLSTQEVVQRLVSWTHNSLTTEEKKSLEMHLNQCTISHECKYRSYQYNCDECIRWSTCICCIQGIFYHCLYHPDDDEDEFLLSEPCSCCERPRCCIRWGILMLMLPFLPCLLCYPPLQCFSDFVAVCSEVCCSKENNTHHNCSQQPTSSCSNDHSCDSCCGHQTKATPSSHSSFT